LERVDLGCGRGRAHFIVEAQSFWVDPVEFFGDASGAEFAQSLFGAFLKADVGVFLLGSSVAVACLLRLLAQAIDLGDVHSSITPSLRTAMLLCKFLVQTIAQRYETAWICP
jgi:hypothetical protein